MARVFAFDFVVENVRELTEKGHVCAVDFKLLDFPTVSVSLREAGQTDENSTEQISKSKSRRKPVRIKGKSVVFEMDPAELFRELKRTPLKVRLRRADTSELNCSEDATTSGGEGFLDLSKTVEALVRALPGSENKLCKYRGRATVVLSGGSVTGPTTLARLRVRYGLVCSGDAEDDGVQDRGEGSATPNKMSQQCEVSEREVEGDRVVEHRVTRKEPDTQREVKGDGVIGHRVRRKDTQREVKGDGVIGHRVRRKDTQREVKGDGVIGHRVRRKDTQREVKGDGVIGHRVRRKDTQREVKGDGVIGHRVRRKDTQREVKGDGVIGHRVRRKDTQREVKGDGVIGHRVRRKDTQREVKGDGVIGHRVRRKDTQREVKGDGVIGHRVRRKDTQREVKGDGVIGHRVRRKDTQREVKGDGVIGHRVRRKDTQREVKGDSVIGHRVTTGEEELDAQPDRREKTLLFATQTSHRSSYTKDESECHKTTETVTTSSTVGANTKMSDRAPCSVELSPSGTTRTTSASVDCSHHSAGESVRESQVYIPNSVCPPPLYYHSANRREKRGRVGSDGRCVESESVAAQRIQQGHVDWSAVARYDRSNCPITTHLKTREKKDRVTVPLSTVATTTPTIPSSPLRCLPLLSALVEELAHLDRHAASSSERNTDRPASREKAERVSTASQIEGEKRAGSREIEGEKRAGSRETEGEKRAGSRETEGEKRAGSRETEGEKRAGSRETEGEKRAGSRETEGEKRAGSRETEGEKRAGSRETEGEKRAGSRSVRARPGKIRRARNATGGRRRNFVRECCAVRKPAKKMIPAHKSVLYPLDISHKHRQQSTQKRVRGSPVHRVAHTLTYVKREDAKAKCVPKERGKPCARGSNSGKSVLTRQTDGARRLEVFIPTLYQSSPTPSSTRSSSLTMVAVDRGTTGISVETQTKSSRDLDQPPPPPPLPQPLTITERSVQTSDTEPVCDEPRGEEEGETIIGVASSRRRAGGEASGDLTRVNRHVSPTLTPHSSPSPSTTDRPLVDTSCTPPPAVPALSPTPCEQRTLQEKRQEAITRSTESVGVSRLSKVKSVSTGDVRARFPDSPLLHSTAMRGSLVSLHELTLQQARRSVPDDDTLRLNTELSLTQESHGSSVGTQVLASRAEGALLGHCREGGVYLATSQGSLANDPCRPGVKGEDARFEGGRGDESGVTVGTRGDEGSGGSGDYSEDFEDSEDPDSFEKSDSSTSSSFDL